jgi:hypothetical protein
MLCCLNSLVLTLQGNEEEVVLELARRELVPHNSHARAARVVVEGGHQDAKSLLSMARALSIINTRVLCCSSAWSPSPTM